MKIYKMNSKLFFILIISMSVIFCSALLLKNLKHKVYIKGAKNIVQVFKEIQEKNLESSGQYFTIKEEFFSLYPFE